ncbi:hypothetical protein [Alkaliflexus imshenetskii]|nr:hypothetical protein [Alkaliflexus imshenetskii]
MRDKNAHHYLAKNYNSVTTLALMILSLHTSMASACGLNSKGFRKQTT